MSYRPLSYPIIPDFSLDNIKCEENKRISKISLSLVKFMVIENRESVINTFQRPIVFFDKVHFYF